MICLYYTLALLRESAAESQEAEPEHIRRQPHLSKGLEQAEDWGLESWSPESDQRAAFPLAILSRLHN